MFRSGHEIWQSFRNQVISQLRFSKPTAKTRRKRRVSGMQLVELLEDRTLLSAGSVVEFGDFDPGSEIVTPPSETGVTYEESANGNLAALIAVAETEVAGSSGANDTISNAQFVANFGTGPLRDSAADLSGSLAGDVDFFSFEAKAGDIIGAAVTGSAGRLELRNAGGTLLIGSSQDITFAHPGASPLPGGGSNAALSYVIPTTGTYTLAVSQGTGSYLAQLRAFRPNLEQQAVGAVQTIFLDFDGATINDSIFGGPGFNRFLSPLSTFLPGWGLSLADQNAVIDSIISEFERSFSTDIRETGNNGDFDSTGLDGQFDVRILNSRDHADSFGDPNVSRIIIGGTIGQLGISTIGIAESIDVGNFDTTETGVVLLDLLSAPSFNSNSLNRFARDPSVTIIDLIGTGVGNIAAHEAGHITGTWHTNQFNSAPNIMDQGGNLPGLIGIGSDNIFGTSDDIQVTFGVDVFVGNEGFTGNQDTRNAIAFGLSTGTGGIVTTANPMFAGVSRGSALNPGGLLLVDQNTGAGTFVGDPVTPGGLTGLGFTSEGILYGSTIDGPLGNRTSELVTIEPESGALLSSVAIVSAGTPISIGDLAIQPGTDVIFGIHSNADSTGFGGRLYTIDRTTGEATLVGDTLQGRGGGLAFQEDGTLLFLEFNELHTLDAATGQVLSTTLLDFGAHDGLAVRPSDGALFATRSGAGPLDDEIRLIDPNSGTSILIGRTGAGNVSDLAFQPLIIPDVVFPTPLDPVDPPGSLIHDGSVDAAIEGVGETDTYEIDIDPGQTITLAMESQETLQGRIELYDPTGALIAQATAAAAGADVVLQTVHTTVGGTYEIVVSGVNGSPAPFVAFSASQTQTNNVFFPNVLTFEFTGATSPGSDATLRLDAVADLGVTSEFLTLDAEGLFSQDVFVAPGIDLQPVSANVTIPQSILAQLAADGTITFTVTPTQAVNNLGPSSLTLSLDYDDSIPGTGEYTLSLHLNAAVEDEAHGSPANDTTATAQDLEGGFVTLIGEGERAGVVGHVGAPSQPGQPAGGLGRLFAYDALANLIREFDPATGALINSFLAPVGEAFGPDFGLATTSTSLLVGGSGSGNIFELDPDDGSIIRTFANPNIQVSGMAFLNDEIYVLTDSPGGRITVIDYATGSVSRILNNTQAIEGLGASETALYGTGGSTLFQINTNTGASTIVGTLTPGTFPEGVGVIGNELFVSLFSQIQVFDLNTLAFKRTLSGVGFNDLEAIGADGALAGPATPPTPGDPADVFAFDLEAGQFATVVLDSLTGGEFEESQTQTGNAVFPNVLTFDFDQASFPTGDGTLRIEALADIGSSFEFITLNAEGVFTIDLFNTGSFSDFVTREQTITISESDLAQLAADGTITFTLTPNVQVNGLPTGSFVTLDLSYASEPDVELEILNANGDVLATGQSGPSNVALFIENFQAPSAGTYFARVSSGAPVDYSLVVTRNATFELESEAPSVFVRELIVNGGFEMGNFSGWTRPGSAGWSINNGNFDPAGPGGALQPISGNFDAITTQSGPGNRILSQSFLVPETVNSATLEWSDRIRNFASGFQDPNQEFRVLLLNSTGGLIQEIFSTDPGDSTQQVGPNARSFDLTSLLQSLAGQTVQLSFQEQDNLGFFNVTIDDVSLAVETNSVTFDFEEFVPPPQLVTSLTATRGDLSITITHENDVPFDIERIQNSPAYNAAFGLNSFSAFTNQGGIFNPGGFIIDFSQAVASVSIDLGDFGADPETLELIAYSGSGATGTVLGQDSSTLPSGGNLFSFDTLSVAAAGIRSIFVRGGSPGGPNSVFYDNITVTLPPVEVELQNIDPTNQVLGSLDSEAEAVETQTITFAEVTPRPADNVTIGNVTFDYKINGQDSTQAGIGQSPGPGPTNNLSPPVLEGSSLGILTLDFATAVTTLEFGFALSTINPNPIPAALVVNLFDAANNLIDSISVTSSPDPTFTGGRFSYSGDAVSRAVIDFNQTVAGRFVMDNIVFTLPDESAPTADEFEITLANGETIQISTATPAGGPGEFLNELDPIVELIDEAGNVVATNDNGDPDGKNVFLTFTATTGGTFTVRVSGVDNSGGTYVLNVNRAPVINDSDLSLSSSVIQEGNSVTLTGTFTDQNFGGSHAVLVNWGDGVTTTATVDQAANTFTATRSFADDDPTGTPSDNFTIVVTVTDDQGLSDTASTALTVENVAPEITAFVDPAPVGAKGSEGEPVTLSLDFSDPGLLDVHTVVINWGDGDSDTIVLATGDRTLAIDHTYAAGGIFQIDVAVSDDDTGSDSFITQAFITGVGIVNVDGENVLYIVGTSGADQVTVNQQGNGLIRVHANFISDPGGRTFNLADVDRIVGFLCEGDDHMNVAGSISLPTLIDAGAGNDHVNGGGGSDVILGRDGDDHLNGGGGFDILIGGGGEDVLVGGTDDDLLFAGIFSSTTDNDDLPLESFVDDSDDLLAIQNIWDDEDRPIGDRTADIDALDDFFGKLFDDGADDDLTGSSGSDWFLLFDGDQATGVNGKKETDIISNL